MAKSTSAPKRKSKTTKQQPQPDAIKTAKVVKVKKLGTTVVQKMDNGETVLNVRPEMHDDGLKRLVTSKRFAPLKDDREIIKQGSKKVMQAGTFKQLAISQRFWTLNNQYYDYCIKRDELSARIIETGQVLNMAEGETVMVEKHVNYSITIKKQVAGDSATKMATKKAVKKTAKKVASKKASAKGKGKPGRKGEGIIEQIRAYAKKGLSNKEIVAKGFNATTVSIQAAKFRRGE